ncbi:flagellar hook-basal body complex protein [Paenirhodobacter populi]|uniref:Flagellar basal-body rod protein FlgF n=1 Tax=Paenirhodobacter populi TaxID=2306993 RepID=A0A443IW35_9RHOB|nr:flagellar hook-basal body complex protein [Sinirhodobacter populi]RWR12295.1 flagellar hook-basal body complex protein [Sinirhodobacter populi]
MNNAVYATLSRQSGLLREMQTIANNMANVSTTGFRREGVVFSEYVAALDEAPSLAMAYGNGRNIDMRQGGLVSTGGAFDLAIEGDGFFMVETPQGNQLTRAGSFIPSPEGQLLTPDGHPVLDAGGGPVFVPAGQGHIAVAQDGTVSVAGAPVAQIGLFLPPEGAIPEHVAGSRFRVEGDPVPVEQPVILQGRLEESNVDPVLEISRMIEVQRSYEMGQSFLQREDDRIRGVIDTLSR